MNCPRCDGRTRTPVSRLVDKGLRYMRIRTCASSKCRWAFATSEVAAHQQNARHSLKKCPCGARMTTSGTASTIDGGSRVIRVRYCEKRCGHDFATFETRERAADDAEDEDPAPRAAAAAVARAR